MLIDRLSLLVEDRPGLTADELRVALHAVGTTITEPDVRRVLYAAHGRFRCDSGRPPRWWSADVDLAAPKRPVIAVNATPRREPELSLFAWQIEALDAWRGQRCQGVVEAVTGAGKTRVGVAAIADQLRARGQALVVVPTKDLQAQWLAVLRAALPADTRIGLLGDGGTASLVSHDVVIAVVNTLRAVDVRPIRPHGLLVADECHRYASTFNRLALDSRFDRRLGLSATYARDDDGHHDWLDPYFRGTCFLLDYRRAVADGVTARVAVTLIGVAFDESERAEYDERTATMRAAAARLCTRWGVPSDPYERFLKAVNALADGSGDHEAAVLARRYRNAAHERRTGLAQARAKMAAIESLAPAVLASDRTIVFTQSISSSDEAIRRLAARGVSGASIHSALGRRDRSEALRRFAAGALQVISAPKILDEGVDVPAADLAIIVGASRSRRQMIQRMGRVLRPKPDGREARFAVLYVEGTVEDPGSGAHEGFLGEITDVASAVHRFSFGSCNDEVNTILSVHSSVGLSTVGGD